ncbi:MAG: DUF2249 domain-containing protein [Pseudonocardia sp.]|nr:DUF2249 domain-containing protein [Pseudonocardia sp.]
MNKAGADSVVIASNEAEAAAVAAVEQHHAQLAGALGLRVEALLGAAAGGGPAADRERHELVEWCNRELVPHALAEEETLYPAARGMAEARLLVDGMLDEHRVITGLVGEISAAPDLVRAAAAGHALRVMFAAHLAKENELILPLLAAAPDVALADLLAGMRELLGDGAGESGRTGPAEAGGHICGCHEADGPGYPELDARAIPHAIRHATILGALDTVRPGGGLVLVAPHDPLPLLAQIERRTPGLFAVDYLQRGPQDWHLQFVRGT